jgi:hypothetical protein
MTNEVQANVASFAVTDLVSKILRKDFENCSKSSSPLRAALLDVAPSI